MTLVLTGKVTNCLIYQQINRHKQRDAKLKGYPSLFCHVTHSLSIRRFLASLYDICHCKLTLSEKRISSETERQDVSWVNIALSARKRMYRAMSSHIHTHLHRHTLEIRVPELSLGSVGRRAISWQKWSVQWHRNTRNTLRSLTVCPCPFVLPRVCRCVYLKCVCPYTWS